MGDQATVTLWRVERTWSDWGVKQIECIQRPHSYRVVSVYHPRLVRERQVASGEWSLSLADAFEAAVKRAETEITKACQELERAEKNLAELHKFGKTLDK